MGEHLAWALVLLAPVLWLFFTQFRRLATQYSARRGGRRLKPRQAMALLALIALLLGVILNLGWP